ALAMQRQQERLHAVYQRLLPSIRRSLQQHQQQLGHLSQRLQSSSPLNTLARGYSVNFSAGKHLRSVQDIKVGDAFTSRLQDGELAAVVTAISPQENYRLWRLMRRLRRRCCRSVRTFFRPSYGFLPVLNSTLTGVPSIFKIVRKLFSK